ncbi:MAG: two-component regulator propeller domain-containing protein [Chthoniobacteraceae bacterium]|nr:two-component regulator propeller domain-containing protein [Chthoniobacteraceae bacterium]
MRKPFSLFVLLCLGVFLGMGALAHGAAENMLSDYGIRQWRGEDGLGEDIVNGVEQSLDGYIWCVTQHRILKFDGQRFSRVERKGQPPGAFTWRGVAVDHRGALWFYGEGGVLKFDGRAWRTFLETEGRAKPSIYAMEEDPKGGMWGVSEQGLYRFDGPQPVFFQCIVEGIPLAVAEMDVAPDGQALVVAGDKQGARLFRFQNGAYLPEELPAEYRAEEVLKVHIGPSGTLWVATAKHLLCRSAGSWQALPFPEGQSDWRETRAMLERQDGELWVGTLRGLFRWRGGNWSELTTRDGFFPFAVRFLKEDREGALWIAGTGGLMRLTPKALQVYTSGLGLDREPCISLLLSGSQWWTGIAGVKPLVGTPGKFSPAGIGAFPENTTASALLKARDGSLWIGTHSHDLWHWNNGKTEVILPKKGSNLPLHAITALLQDRSGKIWAGTLGGLAVVSPEGLVPAGAGAWHPKDTVNVIYEDGDGTIWVGYQTLGLLKILRDGSPVWFQKGDGLPDNSVRAIYRDKSGALWVGTSAGLMRWVKNRQSVFTTAQGLADDAIRQIIEDDFGCLWLGTRGGLMRVNLPEFQEVDSGAKTTLAVRYFGRSDGMKSEECTGARPVKTPDGNLWFPTADGLVMADPTALPKTMETPLVYIEEVRADAQPVWPADAADAGKAHPGAIRFPARARHVQFHFTALDYFAPDRVRFKYRVEGLDADWSAPDTARTAYYREIPPGNYRFRVLSCSRDGVWSTAESALAFAVPPLFWQTVWFKAGAGSAGLSAVVLLFVWRERRKARRKLQQLEHEQALERERARIARDIHDEVGAGLTEVALLSELAQSGTKGPERKYLDDIFKTARDLTRSLDEIVWSINPANDTLEKLISYLVEFARDFLGTASLPCRLEVPTMLPPVTVASTVRHQICLAVKETLHNIVKHAEASEVRMEIRWEADRLQICIRDNGRGFVRGAIADPAATRDGLDNIAARMREIGGCCEQQSGLGKGTCTMLSVEIPIASQRREPR